MRRRSLLITIILLAGMMLTGCSGIQLTTEQNDIISNYVAGVVFTSTRKDYTYVPNIVHEVPTEESTEAASGEDDGNGSESGSSSSNNGSGSTGNSGNGSGGSGNGSGGFGEKETVDEYLKTIDDFAVAIGMEGQVLSYVDNYVVDEYPPEDSGEFFFLEAEEGYKLVVVEFSVFNYGSEDFVYNAPAESIPFRIVISEDKKLRSFDNILKNNIDKLKDFTVEPLGTNNFVIVFHVSEEDLKNMDELVIQYMKDDVYYHLAPQKLNIPDNIVTEDATGEIPQEASETVLGQQNQ